MDVNGRLELYGKKLGFVNDKAEYAKNQAFKNNFKNKGVKFSYDTKSDNDNDSTYLE